MKRAVAIPVIGNGDVRSGDDALAMVKKTCCDAVMVARGAEGNPWVFADVKAALAGSDRPKAPSWEDRLAMAHRHADLLDRRGGKNIVRMRKHAMWYLAGLPHASVARKEINSCQTLADFDRVLEALRLAIEKGCEDHVRPV